MPVVEDEVPQWKKELIQKKQMWKRSGGWSVPPVSPSKTGLKLRPPDFGKISDTAVRMDRPTHHLDSPTHHLDRPQGLHSVSVDTNNNGTNINFTGSIENVNCFGTVSELKTIFQPAVDDDVFTPLTKARSEENILDAPVVLEARRRSSTSSQFSGYYQNGSAVPKKNVKTVSKMEDFYRKYRKTPRKSIVVECDVDSPKRSVTENPRRKRSDTVYFVDMNQNELPPPNTVRQTVKAFEEPVKTDQNPTTSDFDEMTSSTEVPPEALPRARDVVQRFEEKIKSSATPRGAQAPPKPPRVFHQHGASGQNGTPEQDGTPGQDGAPCQNGAQKPQKLPKPAILVSASDSQKKPKHVSFNTDIPAEHGRILNLVVQNDGAKDLSSIHDDLKTVTINTNKSIIIKTV